MPHFLVSLVALMLCGGVAQAQPVPPGLDEDFPAETVAPALRFENDAVVRLDSRRFEVESPDEAVLHVRRVVTVLGPDGRDHGRVVIPYDNFREIEDLDGRLLDAEGEEIRDLASEDVEDYSAISGFSLYEESRVRMASLYHDRYPYTVELEYEMSYDGLISWPTWVPQRTQAPVEHTLFEIITPRQLPARYAAHQLEAFDGASLPARPQVTDHPDHSVYHWSASGLPPQSSAEPHSPSWQRRAPRVYTAPAVFEIEGQRGTMDSWQAFGQWYYDLNARHAAEEALPPAVREEVRALVEGATTRREKVRRLYRYMQRQTRYVSVQLGIGGWKAFSPAYVHENGYGDCKALVYFMQALLEEAGIPSHPALLRRGRGAPAVPEVLPSNQFNHVILAVPLEAGERLWLECTSQTAPFAHLDVTDEDRHALLVKDGASELVRIPPSTAAQNTQHRRARIRLTAEGDAVADVTTRYTGNQQDRVRGRFAERTPQERRDRLRSQLNLSSNVEVLGADFADTEARRDTVMLPVRLRAKQYASRTGARLFFRPNLLSRWTRVPAPTAEGEARTQPVVHSAYPFVDTDTLEYVLPEGFTVEALPDPIEVETPFAQYHAAFERSADSDAFHYRRRVEVKAGELPAEQYEAYRAFVQQVTRADRAQVVLVKR